MANPQDRDFVRRYSEDDAIFPDPKTEAPLPLPCECFHIASARDLYAVSA